ncbi:MAG TPA: SEC-C domain-containing protein [Pyrinomonadaceae bacterium]|nr:SEC-C domain-containing protein [Pyrinomonadaceae bacterium]
MVKPTGRIGRNALCPCGSGKKYRRCCGRSRRSSAKSQLLEANALEEKHHSTSPPASGPASDATAIVSPAQASDKARLSASAIIETVAAVTFFWWLAINYNSLGWLALSAAAAPLVLLRSEQSVNLSIKWFTAWEKKRWRDKRRYSELSRSETRIHFIIAVCAGFLGGLSALVWNEKHFIDQPDYFVFTLGLIIAWGSIGVATTPLVFFVGNLKEQGSRSVRWAALVSCLVAGSVIASKAGPLAIIGAAVAYTVRLTSTEFGQVLGIVLMAKSMAVGAAVWNLRKGLQAFPENFRRLVFCTAPTTAPELVPGLSTERSEFTLPEIWRRFITFSKSTAPDRHYGRLMYQPLLYLFIPSLIYRFALKSTAWFWWPLALVGKPVTRANNPEWFHDQVKTTIFAKITLFVSVFTIVAFLIQNAWDLVAGGQFPDNPFVSVVGYFFLIEWSAPPWQLLGLLGAALSLAIVFWIDWAYKKRSAAERTGDAKLHAESDSDFGHIERLARVRTIVFVLYLALVGFQAALYFNHRGCWLVMPDKVAAWAEAIFRDRGVYARVRATCDE